MKQIVKALRPGGKFVLNVVDRDWLLSDYRPAFWFKSGTVLSVNAGNYDSKTHYNESFMTIKDEDAGETSLSYHRMRLYSSEEIKNLLDKHGLIDVQTFGDYTGGCF